MGNEDLKPQYERSAPHLVRDNSKCILCRRCVAVCKHNQHVAVLERVNGREFARVGVLGHGVARGHCLHREREPGHIDQQEPEEPQVGHWKPRGVRNVGRKLGTDPAKTPELGPPHQRQDGEQR